MGKDSQRQKHVILVELMYGKMHLILVDNHNTTLPPKASVMAILSTPPPRSLLNKI